MDELVHIYIPGVRPSRAWLQILGHVYSWVLRVERPLWVAHRFHERALLRRIVHAWEYADMPTWVEIMS